jgi:polysaccharide export outer membrane protein
VVGRVHVVGLKPDEAAQAISKKLQGKVVNPEVTVSVKARQLQVSVVGEVATPGVFPITPGENVLEVLARAGGLTEFADRDSVFIMGEGLQTRVRLRYDDLIGGDVRSLSFPMHDGDVVVVE